MLISRIIVISVAFVGVFSACGPEEDINVEVSRGLKPIISWDWGSIYCLSVDDISDEDNRIRMWSFYASYNENIVNSPVQYGILPDSTELWLEPQIDRTNDSLVEGKTYRVYIGIVGPASGTCEFIATRHVMNRFNLLNNEGG